MLKINNLDNNLKKVNNNNLKMGNNNNNNSKLEEKIKVEKKRIELSEKVTIYYHNLLK